MSGIEIAGVAFGVVPIIVETLKSYSLIKDKLHTCRHYSDAVEEVAARLASSRVNFNNEIQLLRRCLRNNEMAENPEDDSSGALQESYSSCIKTVDRTKKVLDKMTAEMAKFNELLMKKSQGESIRRLRTSIRIVFSESKYDRLLARLKERNSELSTLRLQIEALKQPAPPTAGIQIQHKPLPTQFLEVQLASRQLHTALSQHWRCRTVARRGHFAKLCLDAEVGKDDKVELDMAISCQKRDHSDQQCSGETQAHIWLYVQSSTITPSHHLEISAVETRGIPAGSNYVKGETKVRKKKASTDISTQYSRKKRIKHVQWSVPPEIAFGCPIESQDLTEKTTDLGLMEDLCEYLQRKNTTRTSTHELHCVGYLQDPRLYKHSFYFCDALKKPEFNGSTGSTVHSIGNTLEKDVYGVIGMIDQLKMAYKLAVAVLQYNETPWLPDHWRLSDLKYLGTGTSISSATLRTLHLSSKFNETHEGVQTQGVECLKDSVSNQIRQGIRNSTLFCLGVALLEIAYWSPIEAKMIDRDGSNPVLTARRLESDQAPPLGLDYQSLMKRCLWCDFGFGDQLSENGLQSAVYTNVVWELSELITKFTKLGIR